jgi:hypothetical protein
MCRNLHFVKYSGDGILCCCRLPFLSDLVAPVLAPIAHMVAAARNSLLTGYHGFSQEGDLQSLLSSRSGCL